MMKLHQIGGETIQDPWSKQWKAKRKKNYRKLHSEEIPDYMDHAFTHK